MHRLLPPTWRRLSVIISSLALIGIIALASFAYVTATQASKSQLTTTSGRHGTIAAGTPFHLSRTSSVDWSKLPVMASNQVIPASTVPGLPTKAQVAAYTHTLQQHHNALPHPKAEPTPLAAPTPAQVAQNAANFNQCNQYLALPCVTHGFPGRYSPSDNTDDPFSLTSASNPGYVMQAVEGSFVVYNFNGGLVYGPTSPYTFFASIMANSRDAMDNPQMLWDATRQHWIILEEEVQYDGNTTIFTYFDIGISKSQNANLAPSQWYLYQLNTNVHLEGENSANDCSLPQLGGDYWGLWISCDAGDAFNGGIGLPANIVFALSKNAIYSGPGSTSPVVNWWTGIPTDISDGSGGFRQALSLTPAEEDGTPDAEFVLATDAGWGMNQNIPTMNGLTTAGFTNTRALATGGTPTLSYVVDHLPTNYADPAPGVNQPSNPYEEMRFFSRGTYQVQYKTGNLYFALTTAVANGSATDNGVYWAQIQPQLTPLDPVHPQNQMVKDSLIRQDNIWAYGPNQDAYEPTFMASSEDDEVLTFYYSSTTTYPSIVFTARRATDAPNLMGGMNAANQFVTTGNGQLSTVPHYSSCSLDTNLTLRGLFWCTNKYVGPHASTGWDTWIYSLQV